MLADYNIVVKSYSLLKTIFLALVRLITYLLGYKNTSNSESNMEIKHVKRFKDDPMKLNVRVSVPNELYALFKKHPDVLNDAMNASPFNHDEGVCSY